MDNRYTAFALRLTSLHTTALPGILSFARPSRVGFFIGREGMTDTGKAPYWMTACRVLPGPPVPPGQPGTLSLKRCFPCERCIVAVLSRNFRPGVICASSPALERCLSDSFRSWNSLTSACCTLTTPDLDFSPGDAPPPNSLPQPRTFLFTISTT